VCVCVCVCVFHHLQIATPRSDFALCVIERGRDGDGEKGREGEMKTGYFLDILDSSVARFYLLLCVECRLRARVLVAL